MRRARIKAVATVPVRRKTAQDIPTEPTEKVDVKIPEKQLDIKVEPTIESVSPLSTQSAASSTESTTTTPSTIAESTSPTFVKSAFSSVESVSLTIKSDSSINNQKDKEKILSPETSEKSLQKVPVSPIREKESPLLSESRSTSTTPKKFLLNQCKVMPCFMRPTPRLDGGGRIRRNSIQGSGASASESEDDSRRATSFISNRVRNDSVCSLQSLKDNSNISNIAKLKRRMVMSESARKLAKARREFQIKHENKSPDKSKLTMYDLIYYNPATNPMKPKPVAQRSNIRKMSVCSLPEKKEEEMEGVDEPAEMLVPQVKVGPNGQLIIDEQSLVIDQYKAQENIDRSDIIVDEDTTGSGFYKRRQKSKEWTKWETVRFYKALHTYGTDFLLMQSIFPKRTRQELKLKYKKEERLNQGLIEKALQYQEFDTEALEKDLANVEEIEKKEIESNEAKKKEVPMSIHARKRKRCRILTLALTENDEQNIESSKKSCGEQSSDENARITITKKIKKLPARKRKVIKSNDNSCEESGKDNSDSEPEVYKAKPTRSGRSSRKNKKSQNQSKTHNTEDKKQTGETLQKNLNHSSNDEELNKFIIHDNANEGSNNSEKIDAIKSLNESVINENGETEIRNVKETENQSELLEILGANSCITSDVFDGITDDIPNMTNLKPGSLVVLKRDNADELGKASLQVYIVSADYDVNNPNYKDSLMPIDLAPDILETVTNCIKNIEPQNVSR